MDSLPNTPTPSTQGPNSIQDRPHSYGDVMTMHQMALSSGDKFFQGMSLPDFSRHMNQVTGSQRFNAGITSGLGGLIKQTETGVEEGLQPMSEKAGEIGGKIGSLFGKTGAEIGKEAGEGIPRMGATMLPIIAGSAIGGPIGGVLGAVGLGSQAAETYTHTGSPAAAAISAASLPLMGKLGEVGAEAAGPIAARVGSAAENLAGPGIGSLISTGAKEVGRTTGEIAAMELAQQGESLVTGGGLYNPLTVRHAAEMLANVLPFKALDVPKFAGEVRTDYQARNDKATDAAMGVMGQVNANMTAQQDAAAKTARRSEPPKEGYLDASGKWIAPQAELPLASDVAKATAATRAKFVPAVNVPTSKAFEESQEHVEKPFGIKPTPTDQGELLPGNTLLQKMPTVLPKAEWEILKQQGIEEFLQGKRVSRQQLNQWVQENGPRVVVTKSGEGAQTPEQANYNQMTHEWFDQLGIRFQTLLTAAYDRNMSPEQFRSFIESGEKGSGTRSDTDINNYINKGVEYMDARRKSEAQGSPAEMSNWSFLSSKPESEMKGYTQIAVTVPMKKGTSLAKEQFPSSHGFPPNTLVFVRGHMIDNAEGKTFFIEEVQSDWAQRRRQLLAANPDIDEANDLPDWIAGAKNPLLKDYERLGLKATIQHALGGGATHIAAADGETATLTQGHDRQALRQGPFKDKAGADRYIKDNEYVNGTMKSLQDKNGNWWAQRPIPQEGGMRLHYDTTLPSVLKELTGYKGEVKGFGLHKGAFEGNVPRKDLVFTKPTGEPKTDITAHTFPLDKAYKYLVQQGGYHLASPDRINPHLEALMKKEVPVEQVAQAGLNLTHMPLGKGEDFYDAAAREAGLSKEWLGKRPSQHELMAGLEKFARSVYGTLGYDAKTTASKVRDILSIGAQFSHYLGGVKVTESTDANFASSPRGGNWPKIIGLARKFTDWEDPDHDHFGRMWSVGHELGHHIEEDALNPTTSTTPKDITDAYLRGKTASMSMTPEEKQSVITDMIHNVVGDKKFAEEMGQFYGDYYRDPHNGDSEFMADYIGLIAMGAVKPEGARRISDTVFFGNKATTDLTSKVINMLHDAFSTLREFARRVMGRTTPLDQLHDNVTKMLAGKQKANDSLNAFLGWAGRFNHQVDDPLPVTSYDQIDRWRERVEGFDSQATQTKWPWTNKKDADADLRNDTAEKIGRQERVTAGGKRVSFLQLAFPMRQLEREIPAFSPAVDLGHVKDPMGKALLTSLWQPFSDKKGNVDWKFLREVGKGQLMEAHRAVTLAENEGQKQLDASEKEKIPVYARLNANSRAKVDKFLNAESVANVQAAHAHVEGQKNKCVAFVAKVAQTYMKAMDMGTAEKVGRDFVNMVFNENPVQGETPEEMQDRVQTYQEAVKGVNAIGAPPETMATLMDLTHDLYPSYQEFQKRMLGEDLKGRPWYHSEVRQRFQVQWVDPSDEPHFEGYASKKEAQKRIDQLQATGQKVKSFDSQDTRQRYAGLSSDMLNAYTQADSKMYEAALSRLNAADPDRARFVEEMKSMFQPGEGAAAERLSPYLRERKLVAGRERLNMVESFRDYLRETAYGLAKGFVADRIGLALNSPGLRENSNYYNHARTYLEAIAHPQGHEYTTLKNLNFFNYLGFNPSSNIVVFLHQALRHAPELVRQGFGIGEAYHEMGKSFLTVGKARIKGEYEDKELGGAVARARILLDKGVASELDSETDLGMLNSRALFEGQGPIDGVGDLLKNGAYNLAKSAHRFYGLSTHFNAEAAFVSAYSLAKSRGASPERAEKFANDTVKVTTVSGGIANRPLELQGLGKMQGEGGLFYNLLSYEMGAVASMARYGRESLGVLPTESRAASIKAFGLMLGTQVLLGGTLGMPFVDGLMSIVDNMFPQAEVRKNLRQHFAGLAGDDQKLGSVVADVAMHGVASLGGLGLGTRLELGRLFNVDPKSGKWDLSEELLGPFGSLINNWTRAAQMTGQGRYDQAALAAAPNGVKGLLKMYVDGGDVRDAEKRLLYQATASEQLLQGLGFRTRRLSDYYEEQQLKAQSELAVSEELQQFHREMGARLLQGDLQGVRDSLLQRQAQSPPGTFDIVASTKASIQSAQDQSIPADPTRSGSRANAGALSTIKGMYDPSQSPTEMSRLQQRIGLTQQLGIPGTQAMSPTEFRQAAMVDQIMEQNPTLSRVEALKIVEKAMNPRGYGLQYGVGAFQ